MALKLNKTMMDTLALALQHHKLTGVFIVLNFYPDTEQHGSLILAAAGFKWYDKGFFGERDISINMTADESTLKQMSATLFDD